MKRIAPALVPIALLVLVLAAPAPAEHGDDPDRAARRVERAADAPERELRRRDDPDRVERQQEREERDRERETRHEQRDLD